MKTMLDVVGAVKEYVDNKQPSYNPTEATIDFTDIISITDAFPKAAKDVKLKVEAVQDLHGYDKPWVGGAGKNILPMTVDGIKAVNTNGTWSGNVYTYRGITYTINVDSDDNITSIKANGTANENSFLKFTDSYQTASQLGLELNTPYTLSGCPSGGGANTYNLRYDSGGAWTYPIDAGNGIQFTFTSSTNTYGPRIYIGNGTTVNNILFYPQMEKGTKTSFESYTNICPITGWDNAKVTRDGKNLLPNNATTQTVYGVTFTVASDGTVTANGTATTQINFSIKNQIPAEWIGKSLKLSGCPIGGGSNTYEITLWDGDASTAIMRDYGNGASGIPLHTNSWINFTIREGATLNNAIIKPMITFADAPNSDYDHYEPYQGKEITISLNGTRYGATIDVTSGVLTLTKAIYDLGDYSYFHNTGDNRNYFYTTTPISSILGFANNTACDAISNQYVADTWNNVMASNSSANGKIAISNDKYFGIRDNNANAMSTSEFKTYVTGVKVVATLATPQTIQLTAEEIDLLQGYNTLFGDTGDISLTYNPATFGNVIEEVSSKMDKSNPTGTGSFSLNRKANTTVGNHSFAEGYNTTASGACSHAEGADTKAYQPYAHAEGYNTTASKQSSHAEGTATTASANCAHAEGNSTTASAKYAHAEGAMTKASGEDSHAEGYNTTASGFASHAEGRDNVAGYNCQHVSGKYNDNKATTLFEVGNGESTSNRSNAFEVYSDGSLSTDNGTTNVKLEDLIKTLVFGGDARTNYKFSWSTSNSNIVVLRGVKGENANYRATFRLYTDGKLYSLWKEVSNGNLSDFDVAIDDSGYLNITIPTYSQWRLEFLPTAGIVYASST